MLIAVLTELLATRVGLVTCRMHSTATEPSCTHYRFMRGDSVARLHTLRLQSAN